jgi:hypothetical protein
MFIFPGLKKDLRRFKKGTAEIQSNHLIFIRQENQNMTVETATPLAEKIMGSVYKIS